MLPDVPLPIFKKRPKFKARPVHGGRDKALSPFDNEILDILDELEQGRDYAVDTGNAAWNFCVLLAIALLATNGFRIGRLIQSYFPAPPEHSSRVVVHAGDESGSSEKP